LIPISRSVPARRAAAFAALAALAFAVSGCGRGGPLEPPPDASAVAKPAESATNENLQVHKSNPPITPPKTPFVLDPLL
jgi:predicted small lipoprotein YifL